MLHYIIMRVAVGTCATVLMWMVNSVILYSRLMGENDQFSVRRQSLSGILKHNGG